MTTRSAWPHCGAKCDDSAAAHAGESVNRPFQILRVIFPAVGDDDVFRPSAHEELARGQVSQITGVEPAVADNLRGQRVLLVVTEHHRRAREHDFADVAVGQRMSIVVRDENAGVRATASRS